MSDIADRVKKIVVEHLGVEEDKVTESASFIDDLGADSLDTVELVMAFEEEFGIEIPDGENMRVVLMEEGDGFVGEVVVTNAAGIQVMNSSAQFTTINGFGAAPSAVSTLSNAG